MPEAREAMKLDPAKRLKVVGIKLQYSRKDDAESFCYIGTSYYIARAFFRIVYQLF